LILLSGGRRLPRREALPGTVLKKARREDDRVGAERAHKFAQFRDGEAEMKSICFNRPFKGQAPASVCSVRLAG